MRSVTFPTFGLTAVPQIEYDFDDIAMISNEYNFTAINFSRCLPIGMNGI